MQVKGLETDDCQTSFSWDRGLSYFTAVAFACMAVVSFVECVRFFIVEHKESRLRHFASKSNMVGKLFHAFLPLPLVFRSIGFFCLPTLCPSFAEQEWYLIFLQAVPGLHLGFILFL